MSYIHQCPECAKVFPRIDKLRLHMLRHTTHREFMCETCGRQFKRKDKLKEHMKRMHGEEKRDIRVVQPLQGQAQGKKFTPKVNIMKICYEISTSTTKNYQEICKFTHNNA